MFLLSDLIAQVRELVQDETAPYRYTDARLYRTLNVAFTEAYRIRPDMFVSLEFVIPYVSVTDASDVFPLDQQFYAAFIDFVVSAIEFSDDEWTVDGRAIGLLALFNKRLGGSLQ